MIFSTSTYRWSISVGQVVQVAARVGQPVRVVDPQPVDPALLDPALDLLRATAAKTSGNSTRIPASVLIAKNRR